MNITIIGGSQGTGAQLAIQALAGGHHVTVVSRSGNGPAGARVITGNATDLDTATQAVTGADSVIITVGGAKGVTHQRAAVTRTVIEAMKRAGTRRLIVQSSIGAGGSGALMPAPIRFITLLLLAQPLKDHNAQEAAVKESDLDWTLVRPAGLTNKPATGTWRATPLAPKSFGSIPRADLGACLLQVIGDDSTINQELNLTNA